MGRHKDIVTVKIAKKAGKLYRHLTLIPDLQSQIRKNLQKQEETEDQLKKQVKKLGAVKAKVAHFEDIYEGLEKLKKLRNLQSDDERQKALVIFGKEIERLEEIIAKQKEEISKLVYSNPVVSMEVPKLQKTLHPIKFFKNVKEYSEEKKLYDLSLRKAQIAEVNFTLAKETNGVKITNNGNRSFKPHSLTTYSGYIELEDKLLATYYLADIPAYLTPYVFFKLITSALPFTISIFIEPTVNSSLIKKARRRLSILEMQQKDRLNKGKLRDQQIDKSLEELTAFIEELVHETEKGIIYSFYLTLEAKDKDELKVLNKELKNITDSMELTLAKYSFGQKKAYEATLPFNDDTISQNRILQSTAASYLMPFVTKQIHDPEGVFLGINAYHDSLVFVNPFTVQNSNINILGVSGAGKSVAAKALATRLYMRGTQIIIIDPEGEYVEYAKSLGGEVIQFSRENGINPFSLHSKTQVEILDHIATLKTFFKFFIPSSVYDGALLDEILVSLYKKNKANFSNFLRSLNKSDMYKYINVLDQGSLQGIFNAKRELNLTNELIVFDISPLGDTEKKAPAMYLLTSLIWQLVNKKSDRKRMLFIDEAHKLLKDTEVAIFYREMVKQARKRNLGVVSITQDVEDFLYGEYGKAILTNSETKILLKQSYATLGLMGDIFPMTQEEKQQLGNLGIGEVVLFRENEHMRVDIFVLPHEEKFILPQN